MALLITVTRASCTTASLGSLAVPLIDPAVWACTKIENIASRRHKLNLSIFIHTSLLRRSSISIVPIEVAPGGGTQGRVFNRQIYALFVSRCNEKNSIGALVGVIVQFRAQKCNHEPQALTLIALWDFTVLKQASTTSGILI